MGSVQASHSERIVTEIEGKRREADKAKADAERIAAAKAEAERALDAATVECARVENRSTRKAFDMAKKAFERQADNLRIAEARIGVVQREIEALEARRVQARAAEWGPAMETLCNEWQALARRAHERLVDLRGIQAELMENARSRRRLGGEREQLERAGAKVPHAKERARALNGQIPGTMLEGFLAVLIREFGGGYPQGFDTKPSQFWTRTIN